MRRIPCFVRMHSLPDCFAYGCTLSMDGSADLPRRTSESICASVRSVSRPETVAYVTLFPSPNMHAILLNETTYSMFQENEEVFVEETETQPCTTVWIVPQSKDDMQMLESRFVQLEQIILNQVQVVFKHQVVPIYLNTGKPVYFIVEGFEPSTDGAVSLAPHTELHVQSPNADYSHTNNNHSRKSSQVQVDVKLRCADSDGLGSHFDDVEINARLRVLPPDMCYLAQKEIASSDIFVFESGSSKDSKSSFSRRCFVEVSSQYLDAEATKHFAILHIIQRSDDDDEFTSRIVEILEGRPNHCIVSASLPFAGYSFIELKSISSAKVKLISSATVSCKEEKYQVLQTRSSEIAEEITKNGPIVIDTEGTMVKTTVAGSTAHLLIAPSRSDVDSSRLCYLVGKQTQMRVVKSVLPPENTSTEYHNESKNQFKDFKFEEDFADEVVSFVTSLSSFRGNGSRMQRHLIIYGDVGCGRTTVLKMAHNKLKTHKPDIFYCKQIDCSMLKGMPAKKAKSAIRSVLEQCRQFAPAVLFLDNIDRISPLIGDEQRHVAIENIHAEVAKLLLTEDIVNVVATARSVLSVHPDLLNSDDGHAVFTSRIQLLPPTKAQRVDIFEQFGLSRDVAELLAAQTENVIVEEMCKLARRIQMNSHIKGCKEAGSSEVDEALNEMKRMNLTTGAQQEDTVSLSDVGGLFKQKEQLTQFFGWPTRYTHLYEKYQVDNGKGVLLCGPSGCGKTLLARAVANSTGFAKIFVKGPELLNKFVGGSEENVRHIFHRARLSAPCVIIFDELDALAPKRGNESSGAADRVVNQLLTEMDGAEGLQRVYFIGCTSRVDLLDSALMRPGRFDVKCSLDIPTKEERDDIIRLFLRKNTSSYEEIDVNHLSALTEGWTPAQLLSWIQNACESALSEHALDFNDMNTSLPQISMDLLDATFDSSKPRLKNSLPKMSPGVKLTFA